MQPGLGAAVGTFPAAGTTVRDVRPGARRRRARRHVGGRRRGGRRRTRVSFACDPNFRAWTRAPSGCSGTRSSDRTPPACGLARPAGRSAPRPRRRPRTRPRASSTSARRSGSGSRGRRGRDGEDPAAGVARRSPSSTSARTLLFLVANRKDLSAEEESVVHVHRPRPRERRDRPGRRERALTTGVAGRLRAWSPGCSDVGTDPQ